MIIQLVWMFFITCFFSYNIDADVALPPQLSLKSDADIILEGKPISFRFSIVHAVDQIIAPQNISAGEKIDTIQKISVEVLNPNNIYASNMEEAPVVTQFRLVFAPKSAGIYTIGPISLKLGQYVFTSNTITINVQAPVISSVLQLQSRLLEQDKVLYPGQQVTFEYKIYSSYHMKLIKEDLPLLRPNGFITVGSPEIFQERDGSTFVQIIQQSARAMSPGVYDMGVSVIEGLRYAVQDARGKNTEKDVIYPIYRAIAPTFTVTVSPFPDEGKPSSFYGAIGSYAWRSRLISLETISLGESLEIEYRASGRGDLSTVVFPPVQAFPGLEERCIIDKWPGEGVVQENTKTFIMRVRPRSVGQIIIPGIFISSFDPASKKYLTHQVLPVTAYVRGAEGSVETEKKVVDVDIGVQEKIMPLVASQAAHLYVNWTGFEALLSFCFSLFGIGIQYIVRKIMIEKEERKESLISANLLFEKAVLSKSSPKKALDLFRKAVFLRLFETGLLKEKTEQVHEIDTSYIPILKEAKTLIERIDKAQYVGKSITYQELDSIYEEAIYLYHKLKEFYS